LALQDEELSVLVANFPPKGIQSVKAVRATLLNYSDTYPVRGQPRPQKRRFATHSCCTPLLREASQPAGQPASRPACRPAAARTCR
jgi:hypothetical protein